MRGVARCLFLTTLLFLSAAGCAKGTGSNNAPKPVDGGGGSSGNAGSGGIAGTAGGGGTQDASTDTMPPADVQSLDVVVESDSAIGDGGDAEGAVNPCSGVACNQPPKNECADAQNLRVYATTGTCDNGNCQYGSSLVSCEHGCANGGCTGDPCVGVSCNTPPANSCADATHLTVHDVPGTCSDGICSYSAHQEYCKFGCDNNVCNGDPCVGQTCTTPPASFCNDPNNLTVYDVPGICNSGVCSYTNHEEYCGFGCESGACKGDPCAGVSCNTPPANYCAGPDTLRVHATSGTCSGGLCSYTTTDVACSHGCTSGKCRDCEVDTDCTQKWCDQGVCTTCNSAQHCGPSCTDCTTTSQVCNAGTNCVDCVLDSHCGSGLWCNANTCVACDVDLHCGASCQACSGETPSCSAGNCVCTSASCPSNNHCVGGSCSVCKDDSSCGANCSACASPTPRCLDEGSSSHCVDCLTTADCTGVNVCNSSNKCVDPGCPPPTASCSNGSQNRSGCSGARVIGRPVAATATGYKITDSTCGASDMFDASGGCWDANADHSYRLYMRKGESAWIQAVSGTNCLQNSSNWSLTLQIFSNAGCGDLSCTNKVYCEDNDPSQTTTYVAPQDGWYIIVVDGSTAFDDEGAYTLTVKLTCNVAGCEC